MREPSTSGDPKRAFPLPDRLDEKGTKAMWRLVAELKVREQTLYNRFASEAFLGALVVSDGRERIGGELGLAQAAAVLPIISTAVRLTARRVALQWIESGWDDEKFRANFEKAGS